MRFIIYFCTYHYTNVSSSEIHPYMYNVNIAEMSFFNKQSLLYKGARPNMRIDMSYLQRFIGKNSILKFVGNAR